MWKLINLVLILSASSQLVPLVAYENTLQDYGGGVFVVVNNYFVSRACSYV